MADRIFVGLSGGVDSAVSAALLKERGFDVVGVFIKIWRPEFLECMWKEDRLDAMRVCAALGIPFREIDLSAEYKKQVVDAMVADYACGITPNPDILCNREIKFGAFAKWAREQGARAIATGHYARIQKNDGHFELLRGKDTGKDQSYFLYRLGQGDLAHTMFPVGDMLKSEVRARAQTFDLPVATKHDSQGLCFVGDISMADFLRRFIRVERGAVLDMTGKEIGEHEGVALYTVGERRGFSVDTSAGAAVPHYVVALDASANTISVSTNREDAAQHEVFLNDVHWIHSSPQEGSEVDVQTRYREQPVRATTAHVKDEIVVRFSEACIAPPGQSLVMYRGEICLGGGIIR